MPQTTTNPKRHGLHYSGGVSTEVSSIIVAGGSGTRFGAAKQFCLIDERSALQCCIDAASTVSTEVVAVLPGDVDNAAVAALTAAVPLRCVTGGSTRSASVRNGLAAIRSSASVVIIHDAARPLAPVSVFRRVLDAIINGADAAVPTIEVVDTMQHRDGTVVDRSDLLIVQTPQAFAAAPLRQVHELQPDATDDASLLRAAGFVVSAVDGDRRSLKITDPIDLAIVSALANLDSEPLS